MNILTSGNVSSSRSITLQENGLVSLQLGDKSKKGVEFLQSASSLTMAKGLGETG